jgi:O-antigen ligase
MQYALSLDPRERASLQSLTEHGSAISMNLLFVALAVSMAIKGCSWRIRGTLFLASLPAIWVYLLSQRRVAIVTLIIALALFAIILFWRQRRTFLLVVPLLSVLGVGYVGAFWNATGPAGFPAQAVKTVIAPSDLSIDDQNSDIYRQIENFNLQSTIRSSPLRGTGFGLPFQRPIPLADISVFEFNEYIPHNSLLWMWIKTGLLGIVAFLYLVAQGIISGVDRVKSHVNRGTDLMVATSALLFVVMFAIYLFVDIAWEARNSVLLGVCLAMCTSPLAAARASTNDDPDISLDDDDPQPARAPRAARRSTRADQVHVSRVQEPAERQLVETVAD